MASKSKMLREPNADGEWLTKSDGGVPGHVKEGGWRDTGGG